MTLRILSEDLGQWSQEFQHLIGVPYAVVRRMSASSGGITFSGTPFTSVP